MRVGRFAVSESAYITKLCIPLHLSYDVRILTVPEHDFRDLHILHCSYGKIVAAFPALFFENSHKGLIGKVFEDEREPFQIVQIIYVVFPRKHRNL
jgi:hypothetical protein